MRSPKSPKQLPSVRKISYPWQLAEQVALVQFVALFEDLKPEGTEWPSFGSRHEYWNKAPTFVQETAGTKYLRSGKPKAETLPDFCIKISLFALNWLCIYLFRNKLNTTNAYCFNDISPHKARKVVISPHRTPKVHRF